jgi:hypothetical protein
MTGTQTQTFNLSGADVTITASVYPRSVEVHITVNLGPLDKDEPDHSAHNLMEYFNLPGYKTGQTHWWSKVHRSVQCQTASQARRVVKNALIKIDDAVSAAISARTARKAEIEKVFA